MTYNQLCSGPLLCSKLELLRDERSIQQDTRCRSLTISDKIVAFTIVPIHSLNNLTCVVVTLVISVERVVRSFSSTLFVASSRISSLRHPGRRNIIIHNILAKQLATSLSVKAVQDIHIPILLPPTCSYSGIGPPHSCSRRILERPIRYDIAH